MIATAIILVMWADLCIQAKSQNELTWSIYLPIEEQEEEDKVMVATTIGSYQDTYTAN